MSRGAMAGAGSTPAPAPPSPSPPSPGASQHPGGGQGAGREGWARRWGGGGGGGGGQGRRWATWGGSPADGGAAVAAMDSNPAAGRGRSSRAAREASCHSSRTARRHAPDFPLPPSSSWSSPGGAGRIAVPRSRHPFPFSRTRTGRPATASAPRVPADSTGARGTRGAQTGRAGPAGQDGVRGRGRSKRRATSTSSFVRGSFLGAGEVGPARRGPPLGRRRRPGVGGDDAWATTDLVAAVGRVNRNLSPLAWVDATESAPNKQESNIKREFDPETAVEVTGGRHCHGPPRDAAALALTTTKVLPSSLLPRLASTKCDAFRAGGMALLLTVGHRA